MDDEMQKLREEIERCQRLSLGVSDARTIEVLRSIVDESQKALDILESGAAPEPVRSTGSIMRDSEAPLSTVLVF
jgi:hypothetical protein